MARRARGQHCIEPDIIGASRIEMQRADEFGPQHARGTDQDCSEAQRDKQLNHDQHSRSRPLLRGTDRAR